MTSPQGPSGGEVVKQEGNSDARDSKAKKICGVCNEKEAKYKCTRCLLPYCSVSCSTLHKASHPATESPAVTALNVQPSSQLNGSKLEKSIETVSAARSRGPFAALEESKELQELFKIYPNLSSQLEAIYSATLPPTSNDTGGDARAPNNQSNIRNWPGARRSGKGSNRPWNQDIGLQCGVQALCKAREAFGKDGEAVREYSKLVLKILSSDDRVDAAEQIQKELAEENARIISQLLNGEI
ncbi:hypothetical protein B7463_g2140, partial [Scytalidium lignicola]